jgi:hypothetical protein
LVGGEDNAIRLNTEDEVQVPLSQFRAQKELP